ncbi:MAG: ribosomal L7Ae/L30e/S12e/Gadd45 family protein [Nanoarchaeota archaeon]
MSVEEIRKNLQSKKLLIGTNEVLKNLKKGLVQKVYLAKNTDPLVRKDIERYATINQFEIERLDLANDELGTACKKPYAVSVIGMLK